MPEEIKKLSDTKLEVVGFIIDNEEYGVDILVVKEIKNVPEMTKVPNMPEYVEGIIDLRGIVVPIIDFRKKFKLSTKDVDKDTKVIIVMHEDKLFGFMVDKVTKTKILPSSAIEPPPKMSKSAQRGYILGVSKMGDHLLMILDLEEFLKLEEDKKASTQTQPTAQTNSQTAPVVDDKHHQIETQLAGKINNLENYLRDSMNTLKAIKPSIEQSAVFVPEAQGQLSKVTQATELATNEMLDRLDQMIGAQDEVGADIEVLGEKIDGIISFSQQKTVMAECIQKVAESLAGKGKKAEAKVLFDQFCALWNSAADIFTDSLAEELIQKKEALNNFVMDMQTKSYELMNSLQFQDITTQQIQHANTILQQTYTELSKIIELFNMYKIATQEEMEDLKKKSETRMHYDPAAEFDRSTDRQVKIDDLLMKHKMHGS